MSREEQLAEELANASFCWNCFTLCRAGEDCPNGCDNIPAEVIHDGWLARLRQESEGGWGE